MSSSTPTAAHSTGNAERTGPKTKSGSGLTAVRAPHFSRPGLSRSSRASSASSSARGSGRVETWPKPSDQIRDPDRVERRGVRRSACRENGHDRRPEFGAVRHVEAWRHDADDLHALPVERHRRSDDVRVGAEATYPRRVIQDRHGRSVGDVVFRPQGAAEERLARPACRRSRPRRR